MERKTMRCEIKSELEGKVEAIFSKMGEVDHEGDLTLPGAFDDGAEVVIGAYAHGSVVIGGKPPVGKGQIKIVGDEARFLGSYFLDQDAARQEFLAVKNVGALLGWSYGYDVLERASVTLEQKQQGVKRVLAKLSVHEVSPTVVPAGRSTATVGVKGLADPPLLSIDFVRAACPPCAEEMERLGIASVRYKMLPDKLTDALCSKFPTGAEFHAACMAGSFADISEDQRAEFCAWLQNECALRAQWAADEAARLAAMAGKQAEAELKAAIKTDGDAEFEKFERTRRRLGI